MAYTGSAIASPRRLCGPVQPGTGNGILYTAPAYDSNVTTPSATAIIKEILLANTTATAATVTLGIGGTAAANQFIPTVTVQPNDTKVIRNLDTMLGGGETIYAL